MFLEKNIEYLSYSSLNSIGIPEKEKQNVFFRESFGNKDYFLTTDGEVREIEDLVDESQLPNKHIRQIVFAIGIHSVNELEELYSTLKDTSFLIIIEPNFGLMNNAIINKDLKIFKKKNVCLFNNEMHEFNSFLNNLISNFNMLSLISNPHFYLTSYYRKYDFNITKNLIIEIRKVFKAKLFAVGNSVEDGLEGLENNLKNIEYLLLSKNPDELYKKFENMPAVIVAAGPSLEKNIHLLKNLKGKAIILAVDTILSKLLAMGIVPDFVATIERIEQSYDYFYKDLDIPQEVTLVAPPLLDPRILEEFKGNMVLPFRLEVSEYRWLYNMLQPKGNVGVLMGLSCAHLAFGMAFHLGASPIILIGQDLSYGKDEISHVSGTIYEKVEADAVFKEREELVEGYYGDYVRTSEIWLAFKQWYENEISKNDIYVINATEGGVKIKGTFQMTFEQAINKYCTISASGNISEAINKAGNYNLNLGKFSDNLRREKDVFNTFIEESYKLLSFNESLLNQSKIDRIEKKVVLKQLNILDEYVQKVTRNSLLMHNIQGFIMQVSFDLSNIEDTEDIKNLLGKIAAYTKFVIVTIETSKRIINLFDNYLNK